MKRIAPLFLAILYIIILSGCSADPGQELSRLVKKSLRDNEGISAAEGQEIADFVAEKGLAEYADAAALKGMIKAVGQKMCEQERGTQIDCEFSISLPSGGGGVKPPSPKSKPNYDLYIENSGSMYGYMEGDTDFKHAIMAMMTNINRYEEKQDLYFINNKIHPVEKDLGELIQFLQPKNLKGIGNTSASKVDKLIEMVTESAVKNDRTAILLSDFIFSLEKSGNVKSQLAAQKYGITTLIQDARLKKKGYGFLILKFNSQFKGKYYNVDNKPIKYDGKRPYFIWVIGKVDQLKGFIDKYDVDDYRGFDDFALIYDGSTSAKPYYTILPDYGKEGRFKKTDRRAQGAITSIRDVEFDRRGDKVFNFSIAVDAKNMGLADDFLSNRRNYSAASDVDDNLEIIAAEKIDKGELTSLDKKVLGSATHVITLSSEDLSTGEQTISLSLNRKLPSWVSEYSSTDDREVAEGVEYDKTFGLSYLVEGVAGAYKPLNTDEQVHFKVEVKVRR